MKQTVFVIFLNACHQFVNFGEQNQQQQKKSIIKINWKFDDFCLFFNTEMIAFGNILVIETICNYQSQIYVQQNDNVIHLFSFLFIFSLFCLHISLSNSSKQLIRFFVFVFVAGEYIIIQMWKFHWTKSISLFWIVQITTTTTTANIIYRKKFFYRILPFSLQFNSIYRWL